MRDKGMKGEQLCDQLKAFVTPNGWINHPLIVEMPPWSAAQINRRFAKLRGWFKPFTKQTPGTPRMASATEGMPRAI
jgi:hypothetical protein